jgi:hypothetical protein
MFESNSCSRRLNSVEEYAQPHPYNSSCVLWYKAQYFNEFLCGWDYRADENIVSNEMLVQQKKT